MSDPRSTTAPTRLGVNPPPAPRLSVTVVIPAYNEEASIAQTIASVQAQTYRPDRIVVVDDCSTDGTGTVARAMGAEVLRPDRNQGTKAQAQNVALPHIDTDLVVTVDADTTLAPDAVERLVAPFARDPTLTLASGYLVPRRLETIWERGRLVEYLYGLELYKMAQSAVGAPVVCSGAFSAFRTAALREHGGFDAGTMAEDLNFTWRVHTSGGRATFVEDAICYPADPSTWPVYFRQVDRWVRAFFQNLMIYSRSLHRKPMLALFVWTGVVEAFLFPLAVLLTVCGAAAAALRGAEADWIRWLVALGLLDVLLVTAFSVRGGVRARCVAVAVRSIPLYFLLKGINVALWWRGFVLEVILRRRLTAWAKGH
jgi:cellulose synthase/poly-beta-1,6-N-acetylglucosamine synthase-like glycosyltransferase